MASVLVTGSSGFLGRAVISRLLAGNHQVVGLDPKPPASSDSLHVTADLSELGVLADLLDRRRITHIIHAGGVSGPMVFPDQPDQVIATNVAGSLNLLRAALDAGVQTFVYCSSVSAIGDFYESHPIPDDYPMQPNNPYGCSKAAMDMVLRGLWNRVKMDLCSLRFTTIYGPGRQTTLVVDELVAAACQGRALRTGAISDWPYVFVDDAADAAIAACFSTQRSQLAYFIAYPAQVSLTDLAAAAAAAGKPVQIEIDASVPRMARGPVDTGPAARDFGFAPKVDHREGIGRMIAVVAGQC